MKETKICMDKNQRRAFQLITAKFVLSYYNEVEKMDISINNGDIDKNFKKNKLGLKILTDNIQHLLMFFSGAGGSGKSEVIKQVLLYCKLFCENIIVRFDASTIRITALTGVAAIRNKMEKRIQAIIYAGCMKAAKKIYDDYEHPPKRRKIKR